VLVDRLVLTGLAVPCVLIGVRLLQSIKRRAGEGEDVAFHLPGRFSPSQANISMASALLFAATALLIIALTL
jgi:hypothetical protein